MLNSAPWLQFYKSVKTSLIEGVKGGATVCDLNDLFRVGAVDPPPAHREGMGLIEYNAMPSFRDVAHDGWLCTFTL
jgi:hypothetical protein